MGVQRVLALVGNAIAEYVGLQVSAGTASAGQLVALNASGLIDTTMLQLDTYRYGKAINANATTSAAGGFDALVAFVSAANTPGSNAARCLGAAFATVGSGTAAGGDLETQILTWLAAAVTASPPGLGLSTSSSPTLAATITSLRASALTQTF